MTTASDRYSEETGRNRIEGVINYLIELQGEVDNDERQHLDIMIADLREAVMCVRAAEYRAKQLREERDEARRQYCRGFTDFCPNPKHENLSLEDAAVEVAKSFGWDCFMEATDDR